MPVRRVTTLTVPVSIRTGVELAAYPGRTPLLIIHSACPGLLVTLTLPPRVEPGHVQFARQLAVSARRYAAEVEHRWRHQPPLPVRARAGVAP